MAGPMQLYHLCTELETINKMLALPMSDVERLELLRDSRKLQREIAAIQSGAFAMPAPPVTCLIPQNLDAPTNSVFNRVKVPPARTALPLWLHPCRTHPLPASIMTTFRTRLIHLAECPRTLLHPTTRARPLRSYQGVSHTTQVTFLASSNILD